MRCHKCNKRIILKTKYCPNCGTELKYSPKKKRNIKFDKKLVKKLLLVILLILLLIFIGLRQRYNEKNIAIKYFESLINEEIEVKMDLVRDLISTGRFVREETKTPSKPKCTELLSLVLRHRSMTSIFD